jgi:translation initiation factor IF-3
MVRLVQSPDEEMNGIVPTSKALRYAEELAVDLVEIVPNQDPPICRVVEYSKFKYEQKQREKENKSRQHVQQMKEIRFGPQTDDHDFNIKLRHAQNFLKEGHKVKAVVLFRGRSIVYADQGEKLLLEFAQALIDEGKIESMPRLEGKRMFVIVTPKAMPKKVNKPGEEGKPKEKKAKFANEGGESSENDTEDSE